jgi:hypothetical protein
MTSFANGSAKRVPRWPKVGTVAAAMECIKAGATKRINRARPECGLVWQPRFFDCALRTVRKRTVLAV